MKTGEIVDLLNDPGGSVRDGVLSESFDSTGQLLDVFQADQAYWKTFWYEATRH